LATYPERYHKIGIADLRAVSTDQSRTFTYTILAEEVVPIAPVVAAQPVAPESTPLPVPGKSDLMMVVLGASVVLITVIIGISVLQKKRPHSREK
jgi:hypothetical protein